MTVCSGLSRTSTQLVEVEKIVVGYKKLSDNLFSADLASGQIELVLSHGLSCFFIVQHSPDPDNAKKQMMPLLLAQCSGFHFLGAQRSIWNRELMDLQHQISGGIEDMKFQCVSYDSIGSFVTAISDELSIRPFVPHDLYLLYDDEALYQETLLRLNAEHPLEVTNYDGSL